jgi:hypothetical protein
MGCAITDSRRAAVMPRRNEGGIVLTKLASFGLVTATFGLGIFAGGVQPQGQPAAARGASCASLAKDLGAVPGGASCAPAQVACGGSCCNTQDHCCCRGVCVPALASGCGVTCGR